MKKLFLLAAVLLAGIGTANAQSDQHIGSYKANDMVRRADNLLGKRDSESFAAAQKLLSDAEAQLQTDIDKAKADGKSDKLALLYLQNATLQGKLLNPILSNASSGIPFDTLQFCQHVDNATESFSNAAYYNKQPNAKGKVKEDIFVSMQTKFGVLQMLTYYYNCATFMDAMGKKQESLDYFQKYVDLPAKSAAFTQQEGDSIYSANAKYYTLARFNLALQNYNIKNYEQAVKCADAAIKVTTDSTNLHDLYLIKINAYGELKDSTSWQKTLVEAYEATGKESFMQNLIYYYIQSNKVDEATALANQLVTENPDSKMAWYIKGAIELNVKKDYKAAVESCDKALAIDPDFKDALFNKGTAYVNDIYDQTHSGKSKFKYVGTNRRITGKTSDGSYQREKAIYDKELKEARSYYENALTCMERVRELDPDNAKRWAPSLQMIYSALGNTAKAKEMDDLLDAANQAAQEQ